MNLSLRAAGLGAIAVLLAVSLGTTVVAFLAKNAACERASTVSQIEAQTREVLTPLATLIKDMQIDVIQVQQLLTDTSATRGLDGLDSGIGEAAKFAAKFHKDTDAAQKYAAQLGDEELKSGLEKTVKAFPDYYAMGRKMTAVYLAEGPAGGNKLMSGFDKVADALTKELDKVVKRRDAVVEESALRGRQQLADLEKTISNASNGTIFVNVASLVVLAIAAIGLLRMIINPVLELAVFLESLAAHDLRVTTHLGEQHNEIGRMARAADVFRENAIARERLSVDLEAEQQERAQALEKVATELDSSVAVIVKSVSATASELQMAAQFMNTTSDEVVALAATVAEASTLTSSNVSAVSAATTELTYSITEISQQVLNSHRIAESASQMARVSEAQIEQLSHAADEIGGIVGMINAIAGQTNMLALNATIEAARAGDAGRGFAVVAQEVKVLAEQTGNATAEISTRIMAIQVATKNVAENITQIAYTTGETSTAATGIAAAVEEQGAATKEIARNVTEASHSVDSVSKSVQAVSSAAGNSGKVASQLLTSSKSLTHEANHLKGTMDEFLRSLRGRPSEGNSPPSPVLPMVELF
jgi:methyl-accepting chemotaxis protein